MTVLDAMDLSIRYESQRGNVQALDGATLSVEAGEIVALVGESGSGKSTLGMASIGLLPDSARRTTGDLRIEGASIFEMSVSDLRELRRRRFGLVLQDAAGSLDPTRRVERQLIDSQPDLGREGVLGVLNQVRLDDPEQVARSYPHELSGGMAQRVAIAIALVRRPKLIVADEPTAALDTEVKHSILELLTDVAKTTNAALLLLTHDMVAAAKYANRIAVMYGGRVVELTDPAAIFERPRHPYTRGLIDALPGHESAGGELRSIAGTPQTLREPSAGCAFAPRCPLVFSRCWEERPKPSADPGRVLCHLVHDAGDTPFEATRTEVA